MALQPLQIRVFLSVTNGKGSSIGTVPKPGVFTSVLDFASFYLPIGPVDGGDQEVESCPQ